MRLKFIHTLPLVAILLISGCASATASAHGHKQAVLNQLAFNRRVTQRLLKRIAKTPRPDTTLRYRAQRKRAPIGWHLMHLASTEDRFAAMLSGGKLISAEYTKRYSSRGPKGKRKLATGTVPSYKEMSAYLEKTHQAVVAAVRGFDFTRLGEKAPGGRFTYGLAMQILLYHEPHHQGQAQATFNIYRRR